MNQASSSKPSLFRQPTSVWAVAFSAVIAFMGIGLVDPILPAISRDLHATPSQAMLLFTSYLFVTAIAMFFSAWVSSRLGSKKTLLLGLTLIVVFAAASGLSSTVNEVIGFRAGWGLGNALFISTSLAAVVAAAAGGTAQAIILYEAALGIGIAVGPLLGGYLGAISWRGPFFGTAVLMTTGIAAIAFFLPRTPKPAPAERVKLVHLFGALRRRPLMVLAATAFFYNYAFFSLLAWSPFPLEAAAQRVGLSFGAHELGYVFFGWGLALAFTSVLVAPRLIARFGRITTLWGTWIVLAIDLAAMAIFPGTIAVLIAGVVVGGLFLGIINTVMTEAVMEATDLPRAVASSSYSFVRFLGGAIAAWAAGHLATLGGAGGPYWAAVIALIACVVILLVFRAKIAHIDAPHEHNVEAAATPVASRS